MATLYFKVSSDYDEVIRLRQECEKLEAQLKKMDVNKFPASAKALEMQLASTRQQMMGLVTEAAKAGAIMENDLKEKLNSASRASDELTEEIIKQRKIIRDTQDDVRRLSDEYSKMGKYSPNSNVKLAELNRAKAALNEQRYAMGELQDQQARNRLEVRKLTREYKEFAQGGSNADEVVKSLTDSLKRTAAEFGGLVAIKKFVSDVIDATGKMQQLDVALSTILQSKSKADALLAEISEFAKKTPFNLDEVANGAKQLLAYGSSADNVVDELSMLGDVASGLQIPLGQLIYLYGTLRVQGRAYWRDIRQFQGRGVNVVEEMAKNLGVTQDQIKSLVEEGKIGFKDVEKAFQSMTSEGGKFNNMLENSAGTWPQRIANIEDTIFTKLNEFGNKYKEVFELGIGTAEDLVESLDDVISVIGALVAAYGTYKAALIAVAVWQKASSILNMTKSFLILAKGVNVATAAMKAFNITSKANLFGALFSVIAGVTTAVYMFTKRADEATASQEALSKVSKKADEEFSSQAATIDRLNGVLRSETASLDQKKKALGELQSIIPDYNASLNEEGKLINNNTEAIKAYLVQLEKQIKLKAAQEELEELYRSKRLQEKNVQKQQANYDRTRKQNPIGVVYGGDAGIEAQRLSLNRIAKAEKSLKDANDELKDTQTQIASIEKEIEQVSLASSKAQKPTSSLSSEIKNASEKIRNLKKEISGLRSGNIKAEAGKTVESTIEAKNKELQAAEKTLETLTGKSNKTTAKAENQRKKAAEQQKKAQEELNKSLLSLQQQNQDDEIALMRDGTEKKLAEIDNDYKKRVAEIDKQEAEFKKKNKEAGLTGLLPNGLTVQQSIETQTASGLAAFKYNQEREKIQREQREAEQQSMRDYLKEYGTYQEKRLAIIEDYNNKIAKANTEGEKLSLGKEQQKALQDLDIEAAKTTSSINELFGDMTDKSLADLRRLSEEGQNLLDFLQGGEWDADKGKGFGITEDQFKAITSNPESMKAISDAIINIRKQAEELRPPLEKVTQGLKDLFNSGNDHKRLSKSLQDITNGIQEIQQSMSFLAESFTSLGDSFGSNFLTSIGEGLNIANNAISSTLQGAQAGSLFGPVGSAVGGAVGLVSSLSSAFAAIHDKKNEKRIQRLQDQIDTLTKSYDKLGDAVEDAYSKDASGLIEDQNKLLEQQKVLIEQQIREEKDKKDTDNNRIKKWQDQIDEINKTIEENKEKAIDAIFGEDVQSAIEDFVNAYSDAWAQSEDRAKSAKDTVKDMMRQMVTESIKSFIQSSGAMDEIRKKLQEFYADNVLSGWEQEYIYNMAEDLQKQLDSKFAWADSLMTDTTSTAQSASSKGFETMSQDTGEELNCRMTAIYEAELNIANTTTEQLAVLRAIYGQIGGNIADVASESKQIMSTSYIQQNNISFPTAQLDALVAKVEGLDAKVADLVAFGADNRLSMQGVDTYIEDATKNSTKSLSLLNEIKRNTQNI